MSLIEVGLGSFPLLSPLVQSIQQKSVSPAVASIVANPTLIFSFMRSLFGTSQLLSALNNSSATTNLLVLKAAEGVALKAAFQKLKSENDSIIQSLERDLKTATSTLERLTKSIEDGEQGVKKAVHFVEDVVEDAKSLAGAATSVAKAVHASNQSHHHH